MTEQDIKKLFAKRKPSVDDVGKAILIYFRESNRTDRPRHPFFEGNATLFNYISRFLKDDNGRHDDAYGYYRDLYTQLNNLLATTESNILGILASLTNALHFVIETHTAEIVPENVASRPRILTPSQYKALKKESNRARRSRRFSVLQVFKVIVDYIIFPDEQPQAGIPHIDATKIDAVPPRGWTGKIPEPKYVLNTNPLWGKTLTPSEALKNYRLFYLNNEDRDLPARISKRMVQDFPFVVEAAFMVLAGLGIENPGMIFSNKREEIIAACESEVISLGKLLDSNVGFLFEHLDPMPRVYAILDEKCRGASDFIDSMGNYSLPPFLDFKMPILSFEELKKRQPDYIIKFLSAAREKINYVLAIRALAKICGEFFGVEDLDAAFMSIDTMKGTAEQYTLKRADLFRFYRAQVTGMVITDTEYQERLDYFPELDLSGLEPPQHAIEQVRKMADRNMFRGNIDPALDILTHDFEEQEERKQHGEKEKH